MTMTSYFPTQPPNRQTAKTATVVLMVLSLPERLKRQWRSWRSWRFGGRVGHEAGVYQVFYLYRIECVMQKTWKLILPNPPMNNGFFHSVAYFKPMLPNRRLKLARIMSLKISSPRFNI